MLTELDITYQSATYSHSVGKSEWKQSGKGRTTYYVPTVLGIVISVLYLRLYLVFLQQHFMLDYPHTIDAEIQDHIGLCDTKAHSMKPLFQAERGCYGLNVCVPLYSKVTCQIPNP